MTTSPDQEPQGLRRALGLTSITIFGIGDILGTGVYGLVGRIAGMTGTAAWVSCVIAGITAGLTGLTYAELTSRYPKAGGAAHFCHMIHRNTFVTFLVIFFVGLSGVFSAATGARIIGNYALALLPGAPPMARDYLVPFVFVFLLGAIAMRGIVLSSAANTICTIIEFSGLLFIIIVGARFLGSVSYLDFAAAAAPYQDKPAELLAVSGASLAFYAFIGFEDLANLSEEVIHPERNVPLGIGLAVVGTTLIYCLVALVAVSVMAPAALAESQSPLIDVVRKAAPGFPLWIYTVVPVFAAFNTALLNLLMTSRLLYGMSRKGARFLPALFSYVHPTWRTPIVGVGVAVTVVIVLLLCFRDIKTLASGTSTFLLVVFILLHLALIRIKRNPAAAPAAFPVPLAIPVLGFLSCAGLLMRQEATALHAAATLGFVALIVYAVQRIIRGKVDIHPVD
ncbi:APC family permease [Polyangium sp. y55x31]|uniref:APC family permease n=1 Tax=Polyangium sp. y55x31 TaxID=3042688 RepID=UPI002482FE1F|nr:APC family permease [Polyangium sp. y55x31]MDI1476311.1 APC family permease [Polyangium sp. y55x31]